jgi:uroporphyrinogen-III synthase
VTGPLDGLTVLLTRDEGLADEVRALGAEVRIAPVTRFEPVAHEADPAGYDWIVFTSRRAVERFDGPLDAGPRIACLGPAVAAEVEVRGGAVAVLPRRHDAESLADAMTASEPMAGARVLFPCAEKALATVEERLGAAGATVDRVVCYRTMPAEALPEGAADGVDVIVFLAPSAAEAFAELGGDLSAAPSLAIGRTTAAALEARGVTPVVAPTSDRKGIIEALERREVWT